MLDALAVPTAVLALLAGLVHVYIFVIEAVVFRRSGHRVFGVRSQDVPIVRDWAYNQGFYNLFLAVGAFAGVALSFRGAASPELAGFGVGMVVLATASMLAAAVVLVTDRPAAARAAAVQGAFPLLALASWLILG